MIVWLLCAFVAGAWLSPDLPLPRGIGAAAVPSPSASAGAMAPAAGGTVAPTAAPPAEGPAGIADPHPAMPEPAAVRPAERRAERLPECTYADEVAATDADGDWVLALLDTTYRLPAGERPDDLVPVALAGLEGGGSVRDIVIDDLRALASAAADAGRPLAVPSAFRSDSRQADVFAGWAASRGATAARRFSARPGHSEHQLGTAVDFRAAAGSAPWEVEFEKTEAGRWLADHATQYGFVMSYSKGAEDETCYGYEPWHFRWVGRTVAADVAASGLTLRAWLWSRE